MFPTILDLGPVHIRSYGLLLALSVILGVTWAARRAQRTGLSSETILSVAWLMVISGVIGGRLLFAFQHPAEFRDDPLEFFRVWRGGLTLYGALIAGTLVTLWVLHRKTDRPWAYADVLAPFVALGEGITRIGCLLNGCCFGKICDWPWAITFPEGSLASQALGYPHHVHPSQLYQSGFGFVTFIALSAIWKRSRFEGQTFWILVMAEGLARFVVDFARHYEPGQEIPLGPLMISQSQVISAVLVAIGLLGYGIRRRRQLEVAA